ncbi:MAG: hypothetical protein CL608_23100 [Anaerolineaceae bacterium]|nr:hypothetical protein [Anaerolineaceae bacterium]
MDKPATLLAAQLTDGLRKAKNLPSGHVLINAADEIIYANKQARHFLGLLAEETIPTGQKFLSLVQSAYQCYPAFAWLDWPKRSLSAPRYLIFSPTRNASFSLLKVEIVEYLVIDGSEIWAVALDLVESPLETAVTRFTHC